MKVPCSVRNTQSPLIIDTLNKIERNLSLDENLNLGEKENGCRKEEKKILNIINSPFKTTNRYSEEELTLPSDDLANFKSVQEIQMNNKNSGLIDTQAFNGRLSKKRSAKKLHYINNNYDEKKFGTRYSKFN